MAILRRPPAPVRALVASAREIHIGDPREVNKRYEERQPWQQEAWDYFDLIGEVKYSITWTGNSMSKLRLFAGYQENPDEDPIPLEAKDGDTAKLAIEAIDRLRSPIGDHSEILRMSAINLAVAGEAFLVGLAKTNEAEEAWFIKSVDEIQNQGGTFAIVEGRQRLRAITANDFILRIWLAHPRFANLADSNMRGVISTCRTLISMELVERSEMRSREWLAGILKVPQELSFGPTNPTSDKEDEEDPFISELSEALNAPRVEEGSAKAVSPLVVRGPAEYLKELQHLTMDRPLDRWFDQRLERALRRLAQGLNVPVEVVLGIGDINHWGSWQIAEDAFKSHIEPQALQIVEALTVGYLRRRLEAAGVPAEEADKYVVWYDPTNLVVRPDRTQDALQAYDRITISNAELNTTLGFPEDATPTPQEIMLRALLKFGTPEILDPLAKLLGVESPVPPPPAPGMPGAPPGLPPGTPPNGESTPTLERLLRADTEHGAPNNGVAAPPAPQAPPAVTAASKPRRKANLGKRLYGLDSDLRGRISSSIETDMRRALKKAGARTRQKVKRDKTLVSALTRVPQHEVVATLGETGLVAAGIEIDELISDAFEDTALYFDKWTKRAQEAALDYISSRLTPGQQEEIRFHLANSRKTAREWLSERLKRIARERLYDPETGLEGGEVDDASTTPFSVTRFALAMAGGALLAGELMDGTGMEAEDMADGAIYGPVIREALMAQGIGTASMQWDYTVYPRTPFPPHQDLDGVEFESFEDEVLANPDPWPNTPFYHPGDHWSCRCGVEPTVTD